MKIPEVITSFLLGLHVVHHKYWAASTCQQLSGWEGSMLGYSYRGQRQGDVTCSSPQECESIKYQIFAQDNW